MRDPTSSSFLTSVRSTCFLCIWLLCMGLAFGKGAFQQHYDKGTELYQQGKYEEALTEFKAAYTIKQVQLVLLNLAQIGLKLEQPREALRHCEMYLLAEPNPPPEVRAKLEEYMTRARQMIAKEESPAPSKPSTPASAEPARLGTEFGPRPAPSQPNPVALPIPVVAASPQQLGRGPVPLYKKWWLWTVVGVVAAGTAAGITGGLIASRGGPPPSDLSDLGTLPAFQ